MTERSSSIRHELLGARPGSELIKLVKAGSLRPVARLAVLAGWTAGALGVFLAGVAVLVVAPSQRPRWRRWMTRRWARGVSRVIGMRVTVRGLRPERPFYLVANHLSYVDIILLLGELGCVFVAKRELAAWPVIGYLIRLAGTIFVDRTSRRDALRVLDAIELQIRSGDGVTVFPEGTSSGGDVVYPLRPALFEWAARSGFPVRVATIAYEAPPGRPPARESICWWGTMSFLPHVLGLAALPRFRAILTFDADPLVGPDRRELAVRARAAMVAALGRHPRGETG